MISNLSLDRRNLLLGGATLAAASTLAAGAPSVVRAETSSLNPQPLPPSPEWARALPAGPDTSVKITEAYAAMIARDAYFWAWPMVNIFNRRQSFKDVPEPMMSGPVPVAPVNRLGMLTDYIEPEERIVACPNQDVVYGAGTVGLEISPVVIQVPDFGERFWVYQLVDLRTDSFVQLGKMYGTAPGFYLLVGPDWQGEVPKGITKADIKEEGIDYNVIKYNPVGQPIGWVNPNLDVANIEAWIAVDQDTPAILEIPRIEGRYYTAQISDEWGEVITNINERNYPLHPFGKYAFVAPGSSAAIPDDAVRIELRSPKAKMLARVEIRNDIEGAAVLQKQFKLTTLGTPKIIPALPVPAFDNASLIGVEIFDMADEILATAPDVSPVAMQLQSKVRDVAKLAAEPAHRAAMDNALRDKIIPAFQRYSVTEAGPTRNNWFGSTVIGNYGDDFAIRSAANYIGIWANARHEVIYFVATRDADGNQLVGSSGYVIDFPAADMPDKVVNAYWSLSLVDVPGFQAVPNPLNRYTFNSVAPPPSDADGSLKIFLAAKSGPEIPETNLLPSPQDKPFSLTFRTYVPKDVVKQGNWFPPAIRKIN